MSEDEQAELEQYRDRMYAAQHLADQAEEEYWRARNRLDPPKPYDPETADPITRALYEMYWPAVNRQIKQEVELSGYLEHVRERDSHE